MAIQTLGQTAYFTITYQDALVNAQRRAQALLDGVDNDFETLLDWFQLGHDGFGPSNRITVQVQTESLARNQGYKSDGTTFIAVDSLETAGNLGDEGALALFVAEMSEVLMSYRAQKKGGKWVANNSMGEGLSVFCVGTMHPKPYYTLTGFGPRINTWLTSNTRNDWISSTESSDTNPDSYGCAIVFLYYLYTQLRYSSRDIILSGGATLEETYTNITGKTGAYNTLTTLLSSYYPVNKTSALPTDDPFPLLPSYERRIDLTFNEVLDGKVTIVNQGVVHISPYFTCPAKDYSYTIANTPRLDHCIATVYGFAEPQYAWKVNGTVIDAPRVITTTTTVLIDNPGDPSKPASTTQTVQILCRPKTIQPAYLGMQGGLDLYCYSTPGHVLANVEVSVTEQYAGGTGTTTSSRVTTIDQQILQYEPQYYIDKSACLRSFWEHVMDIANRYAKSKHLFIWQTLPDPGPDFVTALRVVDEFRAAMAEIEQDHPREAQQLRSMVASMLHTSPATVDGHVRAPSMMEERRTDAIIVETPSM